MSSDKEGRKTDEWKKKWREGKGERERVVINRRADAIATLCDEIPAQWYITETSLPICVQYPRRTPFSRTLSTSTGRTHFANKAFPDLSLLLFFSISHHEGSSGRIAASSIRALKVCLISMDWLKRDRRGSEKSCNISCAMIKTKNVASGINPWRSLD